MQKKLSINEIIEHFEEANFRINLYMGRSNGKHKLSKINIAMNQIPGLLKELKAYKDAEEQGLLLRLPFDVGTEIYVLTKCLHIKSGKTYFKIEKFTIRKYIYNSLKNFVIVGIRKCAGDVVEEHFFKEEIGKIVFEKYEDAEAALKAKQEGKK